MPKKTFLLSLLLALPVLPAAADEPLRMSCTDYLRADDQANAEMSAEDKAAMASDPQAMALDQEIHDYCQAHPDLALGDVIDTVLTR